MIRAAEIIRWIVNISASVWLAYFLSGLWTDYRASQAPPAEKTRRQVSRLGAYDVGSDSSVELWQVRASGLSCLMTVLTKSKQSTPRVEVSCAR